MAAFIVTKSSLIERDTDIIQAMAKRNLISIAVSITSLRNELKRQLEPRASSPQARLRVVKNFTALGIPTRVMASPIIPMINDAELEKILELTAKAGAKYANYILVRLPYEVKTLFKEWLERHYPDRASHVMSLIKQMRGGKEYDATFGKRMRGEGEFAKLLEIRFKKACKRFNLNAEERTALDISQFIRPIQKHSSGQMDLWES